MKKIKVLVVEDHPFCRGGIVNWINRQPNMECCGEADSGVLALRLAAEMKPDVVLLDLVLKDGEGLDIVHDINRVNPESRVLVLSQRDEHIYAHRALRAGARGYLMKSEATDAVGEGIQKIMDGGIYISSKIASRLVDNLFPDPRKPSDNLTHLSDRELQVYELIGYQHSSVEIANLLKISPKTVETYKENLKGKLKIPDNKTLAQTAVEWIRKGMAPT